MKILAFDSTAKVASVAICEDEKMLSQYTVDNGLTQSELLLPMAEDMLKELKLSFADIELYAASVGPGSFTGVRIGAALIKGLAFGKGTPCAEVSTLEALAYNLEGTDGIIVPTMDARRGQVYTAIFRSSPDGIERLTEDDAISITALADMLKAYENERVYLCGDGYAVAKKGLNDSGVKTECTPALLINENAASVARVAFRNYKNGVYTTDTAVKPTYLRMPQAERERLERINSEATK